MKYLILQIKVGALVSKLPFIFPQEISHLEMATAIKAIGKVLDSEVVSAGECHIHYLYCYGGSTSLVVPFKPVDRVAIINNDFLRCMTLDEIKRTPLPIIQKIEKTTTKIFDHNGTAPVS
jgi:hypothetical protein